MEKNNRILIVDDQEDLCEQLAKLLVNSGQPNKTASLVKSMRARLMGLEDKSREQPKRLPQYDIDTASQGEDAFEMVKAALENKAPYAVVFTDMRMPPGWDGLKTAKKIREVDKNIEIVVMTAFADHDQETISNEIGTPEKLLYIKKPFQAEEIFQLALSLTAKWNFEELERNRRIWLEKLILCMRKIKFSEDGNDSYRAILEALLTFTGSSKGLMALWSENVGKWVLKAFRNLSEEDSSYFLQKNSADLRNATANQNNFAGTYLIPLKNSEVSAFVAIYDARTINDPEWYKLMNVLSMTVLENIEKITLDEKQKLDSTSTRDLINIVREIRSSAEELKEKYEKEDSLQIILEKVDTILEKSKRKG
ncbi:response regulator [Lentisphaerota bacterium ZTH]|nr:response regulator [Lentisphaerota bacterium]WET05962.1 response regulator [Lentisphaerota bacterium ZTH]